MSYVVYSALRRTVAAVKEANTPVVVAAADLQVGSKLEDKDVREIKLPGNELPQGFYQRKSDILGRGVVQPISKGEFILPSKLAAETRAPACPRSSPQACVPSRCG